MSHDTQFLENVCSDGEYHTQLNNCIDIQLHLDTSNQQCLIFFIMLLVIHYEKRAQWGPHRKLVHYSGKMSSFVKKQPQAKHYFELATTDLKFVFPEPGRLEGIRTSTQRFMEMEGGKFISMDCIIWWTNESLTYFVYNQLSQLSIPWKWQGHFDWYRSQDDTQFSCCTYRSEWSWYAWLKRLFELTYTSHLTATSIHR